VDGKAALAPGMNMDNVCAMFPLYETPFSMAVAFHAPG